MARLTAAANDLHKAIVAAYGDQGWEDFCREKKPVANGPMVSNMRLDFPSESQIVQLESTPIDERGDRASCLVPSVRADQKNPTHDPFADKKPKEPATIQMVKDKNGWLVVASSLVPDTNLKAWDMLTELIASTDNGLANPGSHLAI